MIGQIRSKVLLDARITYAGIVVFRRASILVTLFLALNVRPIAQTDAPQLDFSTYIGGSAVDALTAVQVDARDDIYLAGSTRSADLLPASNLFPPPATNSPAVGFLTRLRADRSVVYSTYLPRPVVALAVDAKGNAIVVDELASGSKFTGSTNDVTVSKIDSRGSAVIYSVRLAGSRLDRAGGIAADSTGAVVVTGHTTSPDFPLLNALQTTVHTSPSWGAGGSAFITKLDPEGRMIFSTVWGGNGDTAGTGVAIDSNFDIIVAGTTAANDFVTTDGVFQRRLASTSCTVNAVPCRDAFVTRLSADGQTVRYSTLFGGTNGETVHALVIDRFGSPHIAGITASSDLPLQRALQTSCDSNRSVNGCSTFVTKLSPDGSSLQYSTYFGSLSYYVYGPGQVINGLSIDPAGNLVAVGTTQGNDLPLVNPFQPLNGAGPLFKSTDDGATWLPSSHGMSGTGVWFLASGGRTSPLYASALGGQVFRSNDNAGSWRGRRSGPDLNSHFAVDSLTPSTLYAIGGNRLMKSTDAGETWSQLTLDERMLIAVAVAPSSPSNVYVAAQRGVFHSPNGGVTWSLVLDTHQPDGSLVPYVQALAVHPHDAGAVYALFSDRRILRRAGGQQWIPIASLECPANQIVFSVGLPATMYARSCGKVWKSDDDGGSWRQAGFADRTAAWMAIDPTQANALYVASAHNGVYRSIDRGETWTIIRQPLDQDVRSILVDPLTAGTIYIGATAASNAFVARFDPAGALTFSSYLGGLQAAGTSVAVDRSGSIIVGGTAGREFPLVQSLHRQYGGAGDAFLARIVSWP